MILYHKLKKEVAIEFLITMDTKLLADFNIYQSTLTGRTALWLSP